MFTPHGPLAEVTVPLNHLGWAALNGLAALALLNTCLQNRLDFAGNFVCRDDRDIRVVIYPPTDK